MSKVFANPLVELIEYEELNQELERGNGPLQVSGCMDSQKVHLIQETAPSFPWKLVVTYDDSRAREIYEDFGCFRRDVSGKGSAVLQCGYSWESDGQTEGSGAAPFDRR